ncbi:hypothetical protein Pint_07525 [Pistacia integerrima]|uniref:Uncharacterized protein n=1 Tax=Pistacia integerrima TaxID=434235 RepID=A0ACC0XTM0_9ROSI|nr:hypothetical protein Pint_07525 [Pistacia integerrima]
MSHVILLMCSAMKYLRWGRPLHQLSSRFNLLLLFYLLNFFSILQVIGISSLQVNGVDLVEIAGGEVAITNMHSCNGPEFVLQLHFSLKLGCSTAKSPGSNCSSFVMIFNGISIVNKMQSLGGESILRIIEKLNSKGCGVPENYETFSRVAIRHLGRLLPNARWAWLPFMDLRQKKGDKAHLLKICCSRAKCFIGKVIE